MTTKPYSDWSFDCVKIQFSTTYRGKIVTGGWWGGGRERKRRRKGNRLRRAEKWVEGEPQGSRVSLTECE